MIKTKLSIYFLFLIILLTPVLGQNTSEASADSGLQNLDADPLINQLLNNLSSSGVVSELTIESPASEPQVNTTSSGNVTETILTPVDGSQTVASRAVGSQIVANQSESGQTNTAIPVQVPNSEQGITPTANTLSSMIVVPSQTETSSGGGVVVVPQNASDVVGEPLPSAAAPVPVGQNSVTTIPANQGSQQQEPQTQAVTSIALTKPRLFDVAWTDTEVYKVNLIPEAWTSLDRVASSSLYHMQLNIADDLRQIEAKQEVLVRNTENVSLDNLYFHLYPNLLGGAIYINRLEVAGQAVAVVTEKNGSLLKVQLPPSVGPLQVGSAVTVYMEYSVQLPLSSERNYGLFGIDESILSLGHAYPQLAVFDESGWSLKTPPTYGDVVFADTAFYLVEVTAPQRAMLSTTGTVFPNFGARATSVSKQRITVAAGPVRDFYLAASEDYAMSERTVDGTKVRLFYPRTIHANVRPRVDMLLDQTAASLKIFSERLQKYPYTELDISAISTGALGVEYPSIIGMSTRFFDNSLRLYGYDLLELLESTMVHEVGHQWFYGTVGNNQVTEPWLDESLTQYITLLYYLDRYGEVGADSFRSSLVDRWNTGRNARKSIDLETQDYSSREYAAIVYGLGPLVLDDLAQQMGQNNFDALLRTYTQENFWEIASAKDFFALAEAYCGCTIANRGSTGELWFSF